jgi:hypothetical protein
MRSPSRSTSPTARRQGGRLFVTLAALVAATGAAAACGSDGTGPDNVKSADELTFLRFAANAPDLAQTTVTFWAVKGEDRRGRLYYETPVGAADTAEFMTFRVRDESLLRYPNGALIAEGDSVLITITLLDPVTLAVNMQPAGLRFSPDEPAELKFEYDESDDDLDRDGDVDGEDSSAETRIAIWRQELPGQPWVRLSSRVEISLDDVEAEITSFTSYALAF